MSRYFSKDSRIKRNKKLYNWGRNKVSALYALTFATAFFLVKNFIDFNGGKPFSFEHYFNFGNLFQFIINLLLMFLIGYTIIWYQIEDYHEKNNKLND